MHRRTNFFITFALAVVIVILFSNISQAQEMTPAAKESAGMGYSMFGRGTIGIEDLNAQLESAGYSRMSDNFFSAGGGGHAIVNSRFVIGGEGHALLGESVTSGNYQSSVNMSYLFFDLGYVVFSNRDLRVYPLLGLGGGSMNFRIIEEATSLSMDEILANPDRGVQISTGGFLLNLAIGVDYLLNFSGDKNDRAGMFFGIRAGYTISPAKGSWAMDEIEISGAPEIGMTGPYIRFMIGGGAIGKKE